MSKDHKVFLFEKEFDNVEEAVLWSTSIYDKPIFTERVSLGQGRWVIKVSTWIPKQ